MCTDTLERRAVLTADPTAPGRARQLVRAAGCRTHVDPDTLDTAVLLISELVTNSVRHTPTPTVAVHVECHRDRLRVEVSDRDPTIPEQRAPDLTSGGGWGLALVSTLADEHGVRGTADGKTCWYELHTYAGGGSGTGTGG